MKNLLVIYYASQDCCLSKQDTKGELDFISFSEREEQKTAPMPPKTDQKVSYKVDINSMAINDKEQSVLLGKLGKNGKEKGDKTMSVTKESSHNSFGKKVLRQEGQSSVYSVDDDELPNDEEFSSQTITPEINESGKKLILKVIFALLSGCRCNSNKRRNYDRTHTLWYDWGRTAEKRWLLHYWKWSFDRG